MWQEERERDKPQEECGVFGVYSPRLQEQVADLIYLGLYALQHRGQESAGIATGDGRQLHLHKGMGLVSEVFREEAWAHLPGHLGIGHVRYSTTGNSSMMNAQPLVVRCGHGHLALAHNGNLVNASELRRELIGEGSVFQTTTDTEVILN
ncbi:MAG: class II glutamine amidotransferase, partial [Bacillota bacterium]|nr:class II glutamine amidotransferase [Bacillota bacterium]